jgi:hypothetical protein
MTIKLPITTLMLSVIASAALSAVAVAADDIIKPAPTPAPTAGPTLSAAQAFCGEATGKADELFQRYSTKQGLKEVYKSDQYIAYSDDEKNPTLVYTFTVKGHAAHPAAVCRKIVKEGDSAVIKMDVVCDGDGEACAKLKNDFNVMTAKMQTEVESQIKAAGAK